MNSIDQLPIQLPTYPYCPTGFTCGSFDLLHAGHILLLKYAKSKCNRLIVGLQVDPSIDRPQKNKPVQSLYERQIQLEACKYVDEIIVYETEKDLELICKTLDFQIRFLGNEYKGKNFTGYDILLKRNPNFKFEYVDRSHGFSSSELRNRVKASNINYEATFDTGTISLNGYQAQQTLNIFNLEPLTTTDYKNLTILTQEDINKIINKTTL